MEDNERILKLMYMALLEIRVASYSQDSKVCFILADVFHNIPLQINRAEKGEMSYAEIIAWLQEKCEEKNVSRGLRTPMPILQPYHS